MNDFQSDMNQAVQGFVTQITELARRAAINTLESALAGGSTRNGDHALMTPAISALTGRSRRGGGAKRNAAEVEALYEKVASFIKTRPGLRVEQINHELGTTTKDIKLPIRKLIADKVISTKGQKRSTTYYPGRRAK